MVTPTPDTEAARAVPHPRRMPVGAEPRLDGTHFCVWAPKRRRVEVAVEEQAPVELQRDADGYFAGLAPGVETGARYRYRLDGGEAFPDPVSRFQPDGPHGASEVVDPAAFTWTDAGWRGSPLEGAVLYEMHVGTFTPEGTWSAAARELPALARLGVTVIEMMPVADFPGRFGWGYDGVSLFAPTRLYGRPDDLRRFVDEAHRLGLGVILDVVYNHLGPDGNYLKQYADEYFTDKYETEWGEAFNFHGPRSAPVREFFLANVHYWIDEFHMDGLRLDATQSMQDRPDNHILGAIVRVAHETAHGRSVLVIGENEPQDVQLVRSPQQGGHGLDALWNDDLHHTAAVALTGRREAYYTDYRGTARELAAAARHGFLYQGQRYAWQDQRRGTSTRAVPHARFVSFIENHDQVANSARGLRRHQETSPGRWRAMTAYLLLAPGTPMLFQGQEHASSRPFLYFADHGGELGDKVRAGRRQFLEQFPSIRARGDTLPAPNDIDTFRRCVLDHGEREVHADAWALHADLLRLRREDAALRAQGRHGFDAAPLGEDVLVLRFHGEEPAGDRILVVNLGRERAEESIPEPLLAPPTRAGWDVAWSSDDPRYGGPGVTPAEPEGRWRIPAEAAVLLRPSARELAPRAERRRIPREGWR